MAHPSRCTGRAAAPAIPPCRACPVVGPRAWAGVEHLADDLQGARTVERRPRGDWLYRQGDPADRLFALIEGAVVISRDDGRGEPLAVHLVTPGTTMGFRGVLDGGRHGVSAQCATRSVICSFPIAAAEEAMEANRALEGVFFHHMADELGAAQDRMLRMASLCVRDRLVLLLGQLVPSCGRTLADGGLLIATPVSRTDMGALAGMTPETLSRCIRTLESEGLAYFTRRHILVPDPARFRAELTRLGAAS